MKTRAPFLAALLVAAAGLSLYSVTADEEDKHSMPDFVKKVEIDRGLSELEQECISCHAKEQPGRVHDWSQSVMARANVTCADCHGANLTDKDARDCPGTRKYDDVKITPVVTPADCGHCHPREEKDFAKSKHARSYEIQTEELKDPFLRGMTNELERSTGCWMCHGSDISDGKLTVDNWPNEGCGRRNPDGSHGSCVICHTSHHFSISEARKPESCGQCHLGPDHPQDEIYFESKHGKRYLAENDKWNFESAPENWEPAGDFTAPTCAACHMSGVGPLSVTHDVGERLKWESQAPLTIPNKDYDQEEARQKMVTVCTECHSPRWTNNYLARYDKTVKHYNENYYKPAKAVMDELYKKELLTKWPVFDEKIEWKFYEFWHHEGRRARMGAMMMGPDYAWWHGFYDLKKTYQEIIHLAEQAKQKGHGSPVYVPGSGGDNLTPQETPPMDETWKNVDHLEGMPE